MVAGPGAVSRAAGGMSPGFEVSRDVRGPGGRGGGGLGGSWAEALRGRRGCLEGAAGQRVRRGVTWHPTWRGQPGRHRRSSRAALNRRRRPALRREAPRRPPSALLRARPPPARAAHSGCNEVRIASNLHSAGKHTKSAPVVAENTLLLCNVGRGWEGAPSTAPDFLYPTSLRLAASRPFPKRIGQLAPLIVFRWVSSTRFSDGPFSSLFFLLSPSPLSVSALHRVVR